MKFQWFQLKCVLVHFFCISCQNLLKKCLNCNKYFQFLFKLPCTLAKVKAIVNSTCPIRWRCYAFHDDWYEIVERISNVFNWLFCSHISFDLRTSLILYLIEQMLLNSLRLFTCIVLFENTSILWIKFVAWRLNTTSINSIFQKLYTKVFAFTETNKPILI